MFITSFSHVRMGLLMLLPDIPIASMLSLFFNFPVILKEDEKGPTSHLAINYGWLL